MNVRKKRFLSFVLVAALVIASIGASEIQGRAEDNDLSAAQNESVIDLSIVTTITDIVNGGKDSVLNALESATYKIDGITYNNYSGYNGVTVSASSEQQVSRYAIDGNIQTRWETEHGKDPQYLEVDFGNVYMLKDIMIYWEDASAKEYDVEVSPDGVNFQTLTSVTSSYGERTDDIKISEEIGVRTVRVYCKSRTTGYGDSIYEIGFYGSSPQGEVIPVMSNLKVQDYYKYTGKYFIYFNEPAESSGYNVYVDDQTVPVKTIKSPGEYLSADDLKGLDEGTHTLYVANVGTDGGESAKLSTQFTIDGAPGTYTDIPQVYIYTSGSITSEYHENTDVSISVIDKDGGSNADICVADGNIKIRGNTTAGAPKKPWNIKFSSKKSVLGMDKGKKWCLLANSFDKSLMRNSLVYDFGLQNGVTYTSQSRFVEIYLNGKYQGNYLMTEPVEAKTERVDIDAYDADSNDILLELGTRYEDGVDHFTTGSLTVTFDVIDPEKGDDLTDAEVDAKIARVKEYLTQFESALRSQSYDEILKYIDEDTFVNFYIVNELFKNVDFNFSSTRFYIKDNKIYAGPLWDFDLSSGNCKSSYYTDYYVDGVSYKGFYCQSMEWYRYLLKNENFYNKVKERYKNLQYVIQNLYKTGSETTLSIDYLVNNYGMSFARNYLSTSFLGAGWSLTNDDGYSYAAQSGWSTWQQPIEFLRSWLENRNIWLCEQWGVDMESAYEESIPQETETPEEPTESDSKIVAFEYDGTNATAGADMTEYADADNDYVYHATTGTGTMTASVTGTNLKHMEWGDSGDYGFAVPVMAAGSKNPWSSDAYVAYTFSTKEYTGLTASVDVGGTKKGPANLLIGYYEGDAFQTITTYTIAKNKTMYTVEFELPQSLENQDNVTVYIKLADTTNIGGNEMTDPDYITGGELAINNFIVTVKPEMPTEPETPEEPETSTEPETPEEPETSTEPETPEEPETSIELETPEEPETSTEPETPEEPETSTKPETTTESDTETTTKEPSGTEGTTKVEDVSGTTAGVAATTADVTVKIGKTKVKKATKKRTAKKAKITLKKIKNVSGYRVKISTSKKFKKKKTITRTLKKVKFTFKISKFKNKKKLYVKARAFRTVNGKKSYGAWSKVKKIKIK